MIQSLEKYVLSLDSPIKRSLQYYTGSGYEDINSYLRQGFTPQGESKKHFENIEKAFENVPPLEETIIVYRGVEKESYIMDKAYISTSAEEETGIEFSKWALLIITVCPGCKVLPLYQISESTYESEILLDREQILTLTSRKTRGYKEVYYMTCQPNGTRIIKEDIKVEDMKKALPTSAEKLLESFKGMIREEEIDDPDEIEIFYDQYRKRTGNVLPSIMPSLK